MPRRYHRSGLPKVSNKNLTDEEMLEKKRRWAREAKIRRMLRSTSITISRDSHQDLKNWKDLYSKRVGYEADMNEFINVIFDSYKSLHNLYKTRGQA